MQIGIIGLPNVGKSTLFRTLTKKQVEISNYPFCTIDPNVGVVAVPDQRLFKIAKLLPQAQVLPAHIEFVDIAGLVRNAHQGEGLGNQFLAQIREVNALVHVVRGFLDPNIQNTEKGINPKRDIEIINHEILMADLETVRKRLEKTNPLARSGDKSQIQELELLTKLEHALLQGKLVKDLRLSAQGQKILDDLFLLTQKPTIYLLNTDEKQPLERPKYIDLALPLRLELEIAELPTREQAVYCQELGLAQEGINALITEGFQILKLITFYTFKGGKQLRAWPISQGISAPQAAGIIHSDFEAGFIKAEVINWRKLLKAGSWQTARERGWLKTKGKNYVVQDGDIAEFKFKL